MAQVIGQGIRVGYTTDDSTPYTWIRIPEVLEVKPPEISFDEVDVTSHDTNGWKRSIPGLKEASDASVEMIYDPENTVQNGLYTLYTDRTIARWRIEVPDGNGKFIAYEFRAWIKSHQHQAPYDGKQTLSITLKFSDTQITRTTAATSVFA
jgi:predicted secreted protein